MHVPLGAVQPQPQPPGPQPQPNLLIPAAPVPGKTFLYVTVCIKYNCMQDIDYVVQVIRKHPNKQCGYIHNVWYLTVKSVFTKLII